MNAGRWGRRGRIRGRQMPWTSLFQAWAQPPIDPRRPWIRWIRQARARRRGWLEEDYEEGEGSDQEMEVETEDEEEYEQRTPQRQQASPPQPLPSANTRPTAFFAVFDEMQGQEEGFLNDGRPRVENVNERLREHGQEANATRPEIDEVFAAWRQSRGLEPLPSASTRPTAFFAVFDEMQGQEEEFLNDGRPRVENVNERLREHGQEANATRPEIDEVFAAWRKSRGLDLC
jgi:hypothetical protein